MMDNVPRRPVAPRVPVRAIGTRDPAGMDPQNVMASILGSVVPSQTSGLALDPEAFRNAPPWVLAFVNTAQQCMAEVGSLKLALMRRGLLTQPEIEEAMLIMNQQVEAQFKMALQDLERQLAQAPNTPPPDPRKPPQ